MMTLAVEEVLGLGALSVCLATTAILHASPLFGRGGASKPRPTPDAQSAHDESRLEALRGRQELRRIAWRYLPVYALGTLGDWMQGGHIYALYQSYGYSITHIGHIFAIGYSSAAILGTYAAAFGDRNGYRLCVVLYGLSYTLECLSMNSRSTAILLLGRVCGGIAYSLLYVSFESWLVAEGAARALPQELMGQLFATATTVNALSAVIGGAIAHASLSFSRSQASAVAAAYAADTPLDAGAEQAAAAQFTAPFNAAVVPLLGCSLLAMALWHERDSRGARGERGRHATSDSDSTDLQSQRESEQLVSHSDTDPRAHREAPRVASLAGLSPGGRDSEAQAAGGSASGAEESGVRSPVYASGSSGSSSSITGSLLSSYHRLWHEPALMHIGILSSLYEATLYSFVFLWTPALESRARTDALSGHGPMAFGGEIAHGKIFSLLMLFKAAGSRIFAARLSWLQPSEGHAGHGSGSGGGGGLGGGGSAALDQRRFALHTLKLTFTLSAVCLFVPVLSQRYDAALSAFCSFEFLLGFYWPAVAMLRTDFVVEGRSSMMSIFRVLLNVLVICLLELGGVLPERLMFVIACGMLSLSVCSVTLLEARVRAQGLKGSSWTQMLVGGALSSRPKASRSDDLESYDDVELRALLKDEVAVRTTSTMRV